MKYLFAIILLIFLLSCNTTKKMRKAYGGKVLIEWDLDSNNVMPSIERSPCSKHYFLYRDSFVVDAVQGLKIKTVYKKSRTSICDTSVFQFGNLKTNQYYRYKNFVDTAKMFYQLSYPDSAYEGFVFQGDKLSKIKDKSLLRDSIINNVKYKVYEEKYVYKGDSIYRRAYYSLNYNLNPITFGYYFDSNNQMYSLVQIDGYYIKTGYFTRTRISLLRDYLTPEEEKVFATWEKYAKEHPVK